MRAISFVLVLGFVLTGSSVAGSSDQGMPGVGTFAYGGAPIAGTASQPMVVASRL